MHVAVVHGYLLRGTGSNIYVQNLVRELARAGHRVSLFCQDGAPEELDFVSARVEFDDANGEERLQWEGPSPYPGSCTVYRPNLGGKLPVYVYDNYPGYSVQTLAQMERGEIEEYLERNRRALGLVFRRQPPDLVLSQHSVMQPVYAGRALAGASPAPHLAVAHGSCLHFAVKESPLVEEYAREAIQAVDRLVFVSAHSRGEFLEHFSQAPALAGKARVVPAGVDVELFQPLAPGESRAERLDNLSRHVEQGTWPAEGMEPGRRRELRESMRVETERLPQRLAEASGAYPNLAPDLDAGHRLRELAETPAPWILYFGKYLETKGLHLLVAAAPLIWQQHPRARLVLVGFGSLRPYLEAMVTALDAGDGELFRRLLRQAPELVPGGGQTMARHFEPLLESLEDGGFARDYLETARGRAGSNIVLTGYLDHEGLRQLLPVADLAVVPSVFPEAFGLVAVEALSAGTLPLVAAHSGLAEVWQWSRGELHPELSALGLAPWTEPFPLAGDLVWTLGHRVSGFLTAWRELQPEQRARVRQRAHQLALEHFSWPSVAQTLVDLGVSLR